MSVAGKYLLVQTYDSLSAFQRLAQETSDKIIEEHRGPGDTDRQAKAHFTEKLEIGYINTPDDPDFREVYQLYLKNFPIKSEQESYEGFNEAMGYNTNAQMQKKYGPFEEGFVFAREPETGKIIGAVNFSTYNLEKEDEASIHVDGTQHLIYCFVDPAYRKAGVAGVLMQAADSRSKAFISQTREGAKPAEQIDLLSLNEQNQPDKMSLYDYFFDTKSAGIDQYDRLRYWTNRGFSRIDFEYVQPPLEEGGEACRALSLFARGNGRKSVHSSVVLSHLYRFFSTSVLKNTPAETDADWRIQAENLQKQGEIPLQKADLSSLAGLKNGVWDLMETQWNKNRGTYHTMIGQMMPKTKNQNIICKKLKAPDLKN